ncbi:MAG: ABC transporter substrate-binding protein [Alphaproteobacteria bacterium]|nr:ABC transporter substrate-binding protein [Alphaproteobacteria bacterium]
MIKKISLFWILLGLSISSGAASTDGAIQFMQKLGDQVIQTTQTKHGEEKRQALRDIFENSVHHTSIAQFVLGKARRALKFVFKEVDDLEKEKQALAHDVKNSLEEFYKIYKESVTRTYLSSFDRDYKDEVFQATHAKQDGEDGVVVYSTLDRKNGAPPLNLHWVLKSTEGGLKILDLRVEGVSQAEKERDEAASIIRKHKDQCKQDGGKFCDLAALKKLTDDHKTLNDEWKKKIRGEAISVN